MQERDFRALDETYNENVMGLTIVRGYLRSLLENARVTLRKHRPRSVRLLHFQDHSRLAKGRLHERRHTPDLARQVGSPQLEITPRATGLFGSDDRTQAVDLSEYRLHPMTSLA